MGGGGEGEEERELGSSLSVITGSGKVKPEVVLGIDLGYTVD